LPFFFAAFFRFAMVSLLVGWLMAGPPSDRYACRAQILLVGVVRARARLLLAAIRSNADEAAAKDGGANAGFARGCNVQSFLPVSAIESDFLRFIA
jgi:hypothetical protein